MHLIQICCLLLVSWSLLAATDWMAAADQRIREHRMGELVLTLRESGGAPAVGVAVELRQLRHAFGFGTAVNAGYFVDTAEDDPYRERILELFNCAVLENGHKWPVWERSGRRDAALATSHWLRSHDIALRGHTLIWQTKQFGQPMPDDVWAEVLKAEAGEPADLEHVRRRIEQHLDADVRQLAGSVFHWDVTNEITAHHHALKVLTPDEPPRSSSLIADWYRRVHAADPQAKLFVNDYDILVGTKEGHRAGYEATIQCLLDAGAPLHGIGMQAHFHGAGTRQTPDQMHATLGRFARFGLPIWITEFDTFGGGWGEQEDQIRNQTDCFRETLISCFAHPAVEGFVMWGFWDGRHWCKNAPLFNRDWSPKPAFEIYRQLVFGDWWSHEQAVSDEHGQVRLRVFKGEHQLSVKRGEQIIQVQVAVHAAEAAQTISLPREQAQGD